MLEDAVDDFGLGDERDDAHLLAASRARERVNFEDASQQLCPSSLCLAQGLGLRLYCDERVLLVTLRALGGLTAHAPLARRVPAIVALKYLALIGYMACEFCQELECVGSLAPRSGS